MAKSLGLRRDEPVGTLRGGAYYSYQRDALCSVTRLTDSAQASAKTYRYDAFGRTTAETGMLANPFQYTGRERNAGTSLYYYRARTYDPDTGRFLSKDPSGGGYAYAGDNPANFVDPTGMRFAENDPYYNWYAPSTPGTTTTRSPGHDYGGGDYASGPASPSGGVTTGPSGSVWTERCTESVFMFLVAAAFNFMGMACVPAGAFRLVWNVHTTWAVGGSWAAATQSPFTLLGLVISIGWFIISGMDFWTKIAAGIAFGSSFIPLKMVLTLAIFGVQLALLVWSLTANNCFSI